MNLYENDEILIRKFSDIEKIIMEAITLKNDIIKILNNNNFEMIYQKTDKQNFTPFILELTNLISELLNQKSEILIIDSKLKTFKLKFSKFFSGLRSHSDKSFPAFYKWVEDNYGQKESSL